MGDWKEQLRKIKRTMQTGRSTGNEERSLRSGHTEKRIRKYSKPTYEKDEASRGKREENKRVPVSRAREASSTTETIARRQESETPAFHPRIELKRPLEMPSWGDIGRSLQHPDHSGKGAPMSVRIGIDFGTAFTKVAIRAGVDLVLVDWSAVTGDDSSAGCHVIPGFVCRTQEGDFGWFGDERADLIGNLKLPLIKDVVADECPTNAVAFVALVIRYARAYLYRHSEVGRKLTTRTLRWELNIGCPTEPHEKQEIVAKFRKVAKTAWRLAATPTLKANDIVSAWSDMDGDIGLEAEPGVIPEFVAQIAGYLQSSQVNDGLHALVDIGAATLDVATFNVVLPNDSNSLPRIPIFFSAVKPLGTHYLSHNRYSRLGLELVWDDEMPIEGTDALATRLGRAKEEVDVIDGEFAKWVSRCIVGVLEGTRTNRWGMPSSEAWEEGLPIFVTGGGAACELYRWAITMSEERVRMNIGMSSCFRLIELDSLGVASELFGREVGLRTTVAIGLTEDADSIARVVPHRDIEPITYSTRERLDHADLYSD